MNWLSLEYLAYCPASWWLALALAIRYTAKRMAARDATRTASTTRNRIWK